MPQFYHYSSFFLRHVFSNLTALSDLSLASNGLASSPGGLRHALRPLGRSLRTLDLGGNDLGPELSLPEMPGLTGLRLADNRLESLGAKAFSGSRGLRMLNLAGNRISGVHQDAFAPLKKLKVSVFKEC